MRTQGLNTNRIEVVDPRRKDIGSHRKRKRKSREENPLKKYQKPSRSQRVRGRSHWKPSRSKRVRGRIHWKPLRMKE